MDGLQSNIKQLFERDKSKYKAEEIMVLLGYKGNENRFYVTLKGLCKNKTLAKEECFYRSPTE